MLGMVAAKSVCPYFEDEHGEPDTLPAQFINPETGYCQPFLHWQVLLTKQVAWVPTYIMHFRSTVLNDDSDLAKRLWALNDEQIIILLHDGPFKSAQTAWCDLKKSDEDLKQMWVQARRYARVEKVSTCLCNYPHLHSHGRLSAHSQKAATRAFYIKSISALQGPDWEYLYHTGYMSQDESDSEDLVTMRPEYRATWVMCSLELGDEALLTYVPWPGKQPVRGNRCSPS
jgi:hypothetical protein